MASTRNPLSDFILTPQQQSLLFAALNSNRQSTGSPANGGATTSNMSPSSFTTSPAQQNGSGGFPEESPFIDYDYEFSAGDPGYDFQFADESQGKMIGDLPGSNSSEGSDTKADSTKAGSDNNDNEKRSHPDDDNEEDESSAKRQETGDKAPKKPGRKPLTTEPTSKRKAQNRAAQRAFRERKEKHLKDLEDKVAELEKVSQSANQENAQLRAQVDKMNAELSEYKKRLSVMNTNRHPPTASSRPVFGHAAIGNLNDVNFQFEFPKFGQLPGPVSPANSSLRNGRSSASPQTQNTRTPSDHFSPMDKSTRQSSTVSSHVNNGVDSQAKEDLAKLSGIFSPPLTNNNVASAARNSTDSHVSGAATNTSSPSCSSNSNAGPSSSCGTSPEPTNLSPMSFKPDALSTIGEENHSGFGQMHQDFSQYANLNIDNMDFFAGSNNFQFDPQLFGEYREPQQNVLNTGFDDTFFNDAFDIDFTTPYFTPSPNAPKKDLMSQIDAAKNDDQTELVQTEDGKLLTCNKIWEKLQNCPSVQSGDFDLDGLCSDLQKKAKCSSSGAVVDERTFKTVMKKYLGKDVECPEEAAQRAKEAQAQIQA
ncbi:transcription factor PAP1-domain-containing protein [Coniella lustricola]|uniref:Transcription factor PAP1-domain-containing protein n=1 Tax=Coniella lustricola TaxID=2025994 RepID=A0A2T2ZXT1_9PEZI|nr:transcription factor PAP1-domain-containing protein [Coniella lustricola]